jgi:hypothetical protein
MQSLGQATQQQQLQQPGSPHGQSRGGQLSASEGTVDVNVLVQAIKELQMQNLVLNQRVCCC